MAAPVAPVIAAPIDAPSNIMTPQVSAPMELMPKAKNANAPSQKKLVINPYPLREQSEDNSALYLADVKAGSLNRALVEESGMVHPMPLNANMQTGAQFERMGRVSRANDAPMTLARAPQSDLIPLPNNEQLAPMSMPNVPKARYRQGGNTGMFTQAVGFGNEIPLSIALSQIVPENFTVNLPSKEIENNIVSWNGGQSWDRVLNNTLRPLGYTADIQGSAVRITPYLQG